MRAGAGGSQALRSLVAAGLTPPGTLTRAAGASSAWPAAAASSRASPYTTWKSSASGSSESGTKPCRPPNIGAFALAVRTRGGGGALDFHQMSVCAHSCDQCHETGPAVLSCAAAAVGRFAAAPQPRPLARLMLTCRSCGVPLTA